MGDDGLIDDRKGLRYRFGMTLLGPASDRPDPNTAPPARWRRWALVLVVILVAGFILLRPRPIRVPLSDGTTLEISEITTGTKHRHTFPFSFRDLKNRILSASLQPGVSMVYADAPSAVLWIDGPAVDASHVVLTVDRHGWRWAPRIKQHRQVVYLGGQGLILHDYDNSEELTFEVYDGAMRTRLGGATLPVPVPEGAALAPPLEPPPLPLSETAGPWSLDIRGVEVHVPDGVPSRSHARLQFDSRWNGEPYRPWLRSVTITDSRGRIRRVLMRDDGTFQTDLSPYGTVWDFDLTLTRWKAPPLDPGETFLFKPAVTPDQPVATWDRTVDGKDWRLVVAAPGPFTVPFRFAEEVVALDETVPIIVVEAPPRDVAAIQIAPMRADGTVVPGQFLSGKTAPDNVTIYRCPEFDPTASHPLRITFDIERHLRFSVRPKVVEDARNPKPAATARR